MLPGLIDVERLRYDENKSGAEGEKSAAGRAPVGGIAAPWADSVRSNIYRRGNALMPQRKRKCTVPAASTADACS